MEEGKKDPWRENKYYVPFYTQKVLMTHKKGPENPLLTKDFSVSCGSCVNLTRLVESLKDDKECNP